MIPVSQLPPKKENGKRKGGQACMRRRLGIGGKVTGGIEEKREGGRARSPIMAF